MYCGTSHEAVSLERMEDILHILSSLNEQLILVVSVQSVIFHESEHFLSNLLSFIEFTFIFLLEGCLLTLSVRTDFLPSVEVFGRKISCDVEILQVFFLDFEVDGL